MANPNQHLMNSHTVSPEVPNHAMNHWQPHTHTFNDGPASQVPPGYSGRQHDMGHPSSAIYSSQRELDASNPQNPVQNDHIGFGMSTHDIPQNFAMQQSQESGSLPTSGTNQFVSGTASVFNSFGTNTPYTRPAPSSTVTNPTPSFPNVPPFPPYMPTTVSPPPPQPRTPSKKRTHKAAKAPLTPSTTVATGPKNGRLRKVLKSKVWIDTYFKNRKMIKNRTEYDAEHFGEEADIQPHFIATQTAFEYTRRFVDTIPL
ncbi:hypothetical protein Clacol_001117 [Clathrus columnatus]|uniref:Uncharacterized protein n=1 Tax=Clathrus columnatus TaxID=1419009 RepID=A0AAV5A2Y9_9AGAM|nr:hypothetical protein Clacol_001117 [Clathrus columnatus]